MLEDNITDDILLYLATKSWSQVNQKERMPCPKGEDTQQDKHKIILLMILYIVIEERKLILDNVKTSLICKPTWTE